MKSAMELKEELWELFFDRSFFIAEQFYAISLAAGEQAVRYYQEAKNRYS